MRISGIYVIANIFSGKVYVGQSVNIYARWRSHIRSMEAGCKTKLYDAMRSYGIDAFVFRIEEECQVDRLSERESSWIDKYNSLASGYNMIADTRVRRILSDETRAAFRAARVGKKMTEEAKVKISAAGMGRSPSDETRKKISDAHRGRKFSDEHRKNISEARLGVFSPGLMKYRQENGWPKATEEQRLAMSQSRRGVKKTEEHKAKIAAAKLGKKLSAEHVAAIKAGHAASAARKRATAPAESTSTEVTP